MTKPGEPAEMEALDPDVLALLAHAKPIPSMDGAQKAALLADVFSRIGTLPPGGGGGGGGGAGAGAGVGTGAAASSKIALGIAFAVGVAAGVVGDRAMIDRAPPPIAAPSTVTTIVIPSVVPPAQASAEAVSVADLPSAVAPSAPPAAKTPEVPSARGLAAERALLDVARSGLARGEAAEALDAAERHRREYADGALVEEREAIAIKALVALGRKDEAAQRLAHLEKTHPNSIVLRAAKKAVSGAP